MRLGHRLFDRGDNLAGAIYGTILVTSIVAAADSSDAIWQSLGIVEVTVYRRGARLLKTKPRMKASVTGPSGAPAILKTKLQRVTGR